MRKIITTLLALFMVLNVSAQIQRSFYGFYLGSSSYSSIQQSLRNKNVRFSSNGTEITLFYQNFGNIDWKGVIMDCNGGRLNSVTFIKEGASYSDFNYVHTFLDKKYSAYRYRSDTYSYMYVDGRTIVSVSFDNGLLSLLYEDKGYMERSIGRNMNSY